MKKLYPLLFTSLVIALSFNFYRATKILPTDSSALDGFVMAFNLLFLLCIMLGAVLVVFTLVALIKKSRKRLLQNFSMAYCAAALIIFNSYFLAYIFLS